MRALLSKFKWGARGVTMAFVFHLFTESVVIFRGATFLPPTVGHLYLLQVLPAFFAYACT